ncbi:MAG: haloacid dehalogenase-like hydrolase [Bacteroidales bacterium]|nr:haloacid dehalogenase-like hydrolase [Bacteroidales bacterium]
MKNIVVADFDETLLPYDSENVYVYKQIRRGNIKILTWFLLRKLKIISYAKFVEYLQNEMSKKDLTAFVNKLYADIDQEVLNQVLSYKNEHSEMILLSASPHCYIEKVAEKINFKGYGSTYYDGKFRQLYDVNKAIFIQEKYPKTDYRYTFSISDSETDLTLLKLFEKYELIKK